MPIALPYVFIFSLFSPSDNCIFYIVSLDGQSDNFSGGRANRCRIAQNTRRFLFRRHRRCRRRPHRFMRIERVIGFCKIDFSRSE